MISFGGAGSHPQMAPFQIVAHRGARTLADTHRISPENTMPAFIEAARYGAAIELDVIATADGELVVHHDDNTGRIFRLPGKQKPVVKTTWPELRAVRLNLQNHEADVRKMMGGDAFYKAPPSWSRQSTAIPRLSDVLERLPQTYFYIELKTGNDQVKAAGNNNLEERVARLIREKNLYDRVTVISFSTESLKKIKQLDPKIKTGLDIDLPDRSRRFKRLTALVLSNFAKRVVKVDSLHTDYDDTTAQLVKAAHKRGMRIIPWVHRETRSEEKAEFSRLIGLGVDGLMTNAVDLLAEHIKNSR